MRRQTKIQLGRVGGQAHRTLVVGGGIVVEPAFPVMDHHSKLPPIDLLHQAKELQAARIKEYTTEAKSADQWISEFEKFCQPEAPTATHFEDFSALVYIRTTIPKGQSGHLEVSSVATYMRYIVAKYRKFSLLPCLKAIETEAGSLGASRKAPSIGDDLLNKIKLWMTTSQDDEGLKLRGGTWLQIGTGGRPCDVSRLRAGGILFASRTEGTGRQAKNIITAISHLDWKWTKSIKCTKDAKSVFPPAPVYALLGPAPFTVEDWNRWHKQDMTVRPLANYCSGDVNVELATLSADYTEKLTSTSLRDVYNRLIASICDNNASEMLKFTPHRSAKSISSSYMTGRKLSVKKAPAKSTKKSRAK